jgi:glycerol kinase
VETLHSETQIDLRSLTIDGGVSKNNMICEKIATLTNKKLRRPVDIEASARGAAYFAGISCGIWKESTLPVPELKNIVEPVYKERDWSVTEFKHWQGSIRRVLKWQQLEAETVDDCLSVRTDL